MNKVLVKIKNTSHHPLPDYATKLAAGMDVRAYLPENSVLIPPGEITIIPSGLFLEIPDGYEVQIRPRSGLAAKYGITVLNAPGTIDADYRGEVKIILINHGREIFEISDGERIAQMVLAPVVQIKWEEVHELSSTERGDGGFGHTGRK